jgi:hypothetical protein
MPDNFDMNRFAKQLKEDEQKQHSLYGKFANPNAPEVSAENLHAQLHSIASEWEQELDEFFDGEN